MESSYSCANFSVLTKLSYSLCQSIIWTKISYSKVCRVSYDHDKLLNRKLISDLRSARILKTKECLSRYIPSCFVCQLEYWFGIMHVDRI